MILDSVKSFSKYETLHESFHLVAEFLAKHDLHQLEEGKHVIAEDKVWCTISECEARGLGENAPLEVHDSFIDIHVILEGMETIGFRDRAKCLGENVKYDADKDVAIMAEEPEAYVSYSDDNFIICFPQDCHAPLMGEGKIRKAVFKVRI